ncbi:MAG: hypothetical protein ABR567_20440 [Myxococcales bacterium]|nr:hypothetical protein [Myxococcales bacterium]
MTSILALGLAALVAQTAERSSTLNNSANREAHRPPTEAEKFEAVPGGPATPRSEWKSGDSRGKPSPQARHARKHKRPHKRGGTK